MLNLHMRPIVWGAAALAISGALFTSSVAAQIPQPPSTVFGSVTDDAGPVAENLPVEAYIGDKLCGEGETGFTGDGDSQVTVYYADVLAESQVEGCGAEGREVTLKIGDRFATQTFTWEAGPVRLDVTFGDATPAPIPTRTPTPRPSATAASTEEPTAGEAEATIPPGSPGAGSPVATSRGGVTNADVGAGGSGGGDGGGDGFPIWAVAVLVLGGLAAVGGGVGYVMSRARSDEDDELYPPAPIE